MRRVVSRSIAAGVSARWKSRADAGPVVVSCVRSERRQAIRTWNGSRCSDATSETAVGRHRGTWRRRVRTTAPIVAADVGAASARLRSEEHTSELQSLAYLVCRLLLEKTKRLHC